MAESGNKGGRKPRVTDDDLLDVFRSTSDPVLSTAEVAEQVPIKRRGRLTGSSRLRRTAPWSETDRGRNTVWWLVGGERITPGERAVKEDAEKARTVRDRRRERHRGAGERPVADPLGTSTFRAAVTATCVAVVYAARDYIKTTAGRQSKTSSRTSCRTTRSATTSTRRSGKIDAGDRYRGSWWRKIVKPGLKALDDVKPHHKARAPGGLRATSARIRRPAASTTRRRSSNP